MCVALVEPICFAEKDIPQIRLQQYQSIMSNTPIQCNSLHRHPGQHRSIRFNPPHRHPGQYNSMKSNPQQPPLQTRPPLKSRPQSQPWHQHRRYHTQPIPQNITKQGTNTT
ncbi:unnamed protein product [Macrosiphum euphorbiae]|uniref:Uncharacterized protein n=1 Tax=Macrosiphum euphorbiae TaxID=13131 RepID=A0AAV0Y2P9_9HEMI|nr:unnamed protein product [Macrosiphum euphorbiae]